jgi:hypothetical protein
VPLVDDARGKSLRARCAHVVLVLHVEHCGARDARDDGERDRAERNRRQDQMLDRVEERLHIARNDGVEHVEARGVVDVDQDVLTPDGG